MKPVVAIYRDLLLPFSETFVAAQARALRSYDPVMVGLEWEVSGKHLVNNMRSAVLADYTRSPVLRRRAFRIAGLASKGWVDAISAAAPRLLHIHFGVDAAWGSTLAKRLEIPFIVTFHGYDATICERRVQKRQSASYRLYLRRRAQVFHEARTCVVVSEFMKSKLLDAGCPESKIEVRYIGVDVEDFTPPLLDIRHKNLVVFVGRLSRLKGVADLIEAIRVVRRAQPKTRLVVVGDGPDRRALESHALSALGDGYLFTGRLSPSEVRQWMQQATVVAVPSRVRACGCGEPFGLVAAEAQAMATPVVAYAAGGLLEVVESGRSGLLAPEGNTVELGNLLGAVLSDEDLARRLGAAGRQRVQSRFNLRTNTAGLEELYMRAAARNSMAPISRPL